MVKPKSDIRIILRYSFAVAMLLVGLIANKYNFGNEFLGFSSVGNWLIYIGFVMIAVVFLQSLVKKKRVVDERMLFVASKASRITFLFIIMFSFVIMIVDGFNKIDMQYSYFMSYFICIIILVYVISYKILLKYY